VGVVICVGKIMEKEYYRELRKWEFKLCNSRRIFDRFKERAQKQRWRNNKDDGVEESEAVE